MKTGIELLVEALGALETERGMRIIQQESSKCRAIANADHISTLAEEVERLQKELNLHTKLALAVSDLLGVPSGDTAQQLSDKLCDAGYQIPAFLPEKLLNL